MIILNMNSSTEKFHNASQRKHITFDCSNKSKQHERVMFCTQKCISINSIRNEENKEYQKKLMNSSHRTYTASEKTSFNAFSEAGNMNISKPLEHLQNRKKEQDKLNSSKYLDVFKGSQDELQVSCVPINHFNYRSFHLNIDRPNRKERQSRIQKAIHDKKDLESFNDQSIKNRPHSIANTRMNQSFLISRPRNHSMLRKVIGNNQKYRQFQKNLKAKVFVVSLTDFMRNNAQEEEKKNINTQSVKIQNGSFGINSYLQSVTNSNNDSIDSKQCHSHHPHSHKRNVLMHRNEKHNMFEPVILEPPTLPIIKGWSNIQQEATISNLQQFQN